MNQNIKDKVITVKTDEKNISQDNNLANNTSNQKNHQAFNVELSRLKKAKESCMYDKNNCDEFLRLGGEKRMLQIEPMVEVPKKADEMRRKTQQVTNPNNTTQKEKDPTAVGVAKVTKSADHSGGEVNKILDNKQALSEEISSIKYLIEYMNNNNKKQNL